MVKFLKRLFTLKVLSGALYIAAILLTLRWMLLEKFSPEPISAIPQILLAALGFFTNRKANKVNLELFKDFQRQLNNAEDELKRFNPKSALVQLISLEKSIGDSTLPKKYSSRLYAELYYLKGNCNSDLGLSNEVYPLLISAFNHQKGDPKLIERACTSFYFIGEKEKAIKLANKILKYQVHNPRAWAVKVADVANLSLLDLPTPVRVSKKFKNILATAYIKQDRYSELNALIAEELNGLNLPDQIEYEALPYWMLVCSVLYNTELKEFPNDMLNRRDDSTGKSNRIKICLKLSGSILKLIDGSQLFNENRYYRQSEFIYYHLKYLVDNDSQGVLNMYAYFKKLPKSEDNFRLLAHLIPSLSQIKEYDKVIELCEDNPHSQFSYTQVLAFSHFLKNNFEKSCEYFLAYIKEVNKINDGVVGNLIMSLNVLYRYSNLDTRKVFEELLKNKTYERIELKNILKAISLQFYFNPNENSEIGELLELDLDTFDTFSENLKDNVCKTLTSIGEFDRSDQYLLRYLNENHESQSLYLHIKNQINLKSNHARLLTLLENWRNNFSPIKEFLQHELEILNQLSMYAQIEVVAEFGLKHFPEDPSIQTILILALDREGKREKLKEVLTQKLLKIPFHWEHAFLIGAICFKEGEGQLGFDLIYPYAKNNPDNATIRQGYFGLVTLQANKYKVKKFEAVESDTTVRLTYNSETKIIHINESTLGSNNIAKAILGKKIGDTIKIKEGFSKESIVIINDILDKYTGLVAEISEEVSSSFKVSGYQMKSITWKSNDIEELNRKFVEEFGADSELRKLTIEDAFNSYYDGKISFTELVRRTDQHKIFEVYETVTRNNSKGFIIPPEAIFKNADYSQITEYVIDFTVLPILSKWKSVSSQKGYKFVVSQHIKDFIKDKISEVQLLDDNPLTLIISLQGVQPIPYPPNYKLNFIAELEGMLDWIDKNCVVGFAPEKLDILLKQPELLERNDWYFKYLIDTTFLANRPNRVLITDDLIYFRLFSHLAKPITLEHFIKMKEPDETPIFMKWFLKNNYIGLTLSLSDLRKSFDESPILDGSSLFQKCLKNLPFNWHKNENLIFEIIDLAKYMYAHQLNLDYKLRLIEALFVETLKGYPIKPTSSKEFQQKIHEAFHLLGMAEKHVLQALLNALRIINGK